MLEHTGASAGSGLFGRSNLVIALAAACTVGCVAQTPTAPGDDPDPDTNAAPTAFAGQDLLVSLGLPVALRAGGDDADGDTVTYQWGFWAPTDSDAGLDDETSERPSFTPDVAGAYGASLVVSDGMAESAPDTVRITAEDNTTTATLGAGGGQLVSRVGKLRLSLEAGALARDTTISVVRVGRGQTAVLGLGLEEKLLDDEQLAAFDLWMGEYDASPDPLVSPGTGAIDLWRDPSFDGDTALFTPSDFFMESDDDARPVDDALSELDLDEGRVYHTGVLSSLAAVALIPSGFDLKVTGLPDEVAVGDTFSVSLAGAWWAGGVGPSDAEIETTAGAPLVGLEPVSGDGSFTVALMGDAFGTKLSYRCASSGAAPVRLGVRVGEASGRSSIRKTVRCVNRRGGGIPLGLHQLPEGLTHPEGAYPLTGPLGSVANAMGDAFAFSGREGLMVVGLTDNRVLIDRTQVGSTNPFTRVLAVSRPDPGPTTPAALFGSGIDFANPLNPMGGAIFRYSPLEGRFVEVATEVPGAFWDVQPAGGTVSDEIVAATNYGVRFLQYDAALESWAHAPDDDLPLDRYGLPHLLGTTTAVAATAGGPLLVGVGYHNPAVADQLVFDDRGPGGPVVVGDLGQSPAAIRCIPPVCVVVLARDDAIQPVVWDGATVPTIAGDPVPVGVGPGAAALFRVSEGITLSATFTGWDDDVVTLTELDDAGNVLANRSMDLRAVGCPGPRIGGWVPDPAEPDNPSLVIGCYDAHAYYITKRHSF